mmetsp:Transcript_85565/g.228912  ORF Transcript_85565/g.228912 Transcript_85565/m.228912 type:complete len:380 (+) Transcript_85565:529-1668(+)
MDMAERPPHRCSEREASRIIGQVLKAVLCCHVHHIIHKDVKPENFVFMSDHKSPLKMIDLGLSEFQTEQHDWALSGSFPYMAPEILNATGHDERSDVWSVGCILFALLLGKPFVPNESEHVIRELLKEPEQYLEMRLRECDAKNILSRDALDLIRRMLAKDPEDRLEAAQALQHRFVLKGYDDSSSTIPVSARKILAQKALSRMRHYALELPALRRIALIMIAHFTWEEDVQDMSHLFRLFDKHGDGELTHQEIIEGFRSLGVRLPEDFDDVIRGIGSKYPDKVTFVEFQAATLAMSVYRRPEYIRVVWRALDVQKQGRITTKDLAEVLPHATVADIEELFAEVSGTGKGMDEQAFHDMFHRAESVTGLPYQPRAPPVG